LSDHSYTDNDALPDADPDQNGVANLVQYALGIDLNVINSPRLPHLDLTVDSQTYATFTFTRNLAASEVIYTVFYSTDLIDWNLANPIWVSTSGDDTQLIERTDNQDGTETLTVQHVETIQTHPNLFMRLEVSLP
jgi:hypothetical protein